jgi:hypothetical protein
MTETNLLFHLPENVRAVSISPSLSRSSGLAVGRQAAGGPGHYLILLRQRYASRRGAWAAQFSTIWERHLRDYRDFNF